MLQRMLLLTFASLTQALSYFHQPRVSTLPLAHNAQVEELQHNNQQYRAAQGGTFERVNGLNDEIRLETQKSAPDDSALGAHYTEIETLCRQAESPLRDMQQRQVRVLNEDQRARLATLQQAQLAQAVSIAAEGRMLIPPRVLLPAGFPTVFNGTPTRAIYTASPFFATVGGPEVTPDLVA